MSRLALTTAALLLAAPAAHAQASPMHPFDLWVGQWKGAGWSISATGARTEFSLVERVERKAGGTVLNLGGISEDQIPANSTTGRAWAQNSVPAFMRVEPVTTSGPTSGAITTSWDCSSSSEG